jgi:hypothetical protein
MEGVISVRQYECGKHRLKRKVSIDNTKGDIAAKYQDLRVVWDKSGKWKEMVQCYKSYQNISTSEYVYQDIMKGITEMLQCHELHQIWEWGQAQDKQSEFLEAQLLDYLMEESA